MIRLVSLGFVLVCAGCSTFHIPTVPRDSVDYNQAIEQMSNEIALLNVVRAKKWLPRHFTSISQIQGNLKITGSAELSAALPIDAVTKRIESAVGVTNVRTPRADSYAPKLSTSVTTNPNFTVSILESEEFYRGILSPIEASVIATYLDQGWNPELVAHVMFESLDFVFSDGAVLRLDNDHRTGSAWRVLVSDIDFTMAGDGVYGASEPVSRRFEGFNAFSCCVERD
ncbi:MAG: hypothetical protein GKR90_08620 [Pseudomonadales bacterium]|nr:hypothetical protein [Pseudomonadales bacterium]